VADAQRRSDGIIGAWPVAELASFESRGEAAMIAAAVGDALGWPQEARAGRVGGRRGVEPQLDFVEWRRRQGGRYAGHEEVIGPGHYSDDTQLIAAVGRSLLAGDQWWERWTRLELPFWLLYERGGGGATKRAAQAWTKGNAPWEGELRQRYFAAGGNGVAMRVLPHCLRHDDFDFVANSIFADAIATHGHPRAQIGALAYGYALWRALRRRDRLPYGALIEETRTDVDLWSHRPAVDNVAPDWKAAADDAGLGTYDEVWQKTISEMMDLLSVCAKAINQGALSVDRETLETLGAFDKKISSAGTITAAGALFLASRYASRAEQGLLAAAFAHDADTDTLASMTGSLLAAINGGDWLGKAREAVQDDRYLLRLARALVGPIEQTQSSPDANARSFAPRLDGTDVGTELALPDGRIGHVRNVVEHLTKSRNEIKTFVVETDDGQTLFLKRLRRLKEEPAISVERPAQRRRARIAVGLKVGDLDRSVAFWRDIVGLDVVITDHYVNVGGYIALFQTTDPGSAQSLQLDLAPDGDLRQPKRWILLFVSRRELNEILKRLNRAGVPTLSVGPTGEWRRVRCADPDGNVVELSERESSP
jgi:ADP-ribosylglycohydrolase/catechol 2,3-dioxygenase-like lactoylglutathione lyase family enzyme